MTKETFWDAILLGKSNVKNIEFPGYDMSQYKCRIAAPVDNFNLIDFIHASKDLKHLGRTAQFALAASKMALEDAGFSLTYHDNKIPGGQYVIEDLDPYKIGAILGVSVENMDLMEKYHEILLKNRGPKRITPFALPHIYISSVASNVATKFNLKGINYCVSAACASGTDGLITGYHYLLHGEEDIMLVGGVDACITPYVFGGFIALRAMSTRNDDPLHACRPFDRERDGFVMGEGAGIMVLERLEHAIARKAKIYAEVIGCGITADAFHLTHPDPEADPIVQAMRVALKDANISINDVDYINAHGTSTRHNDRVETKAIKKLFGKRAYKIPVSSTKSTTAHLIGAAGAVEAIATAFALKYSVIPPTINYEFPDPECDLDYVPNVKREQNINIAISNSLGFGGLNSVIVLKKYT